METLAPLLEPINEKGSEKAERDRATRAERSAQILRAAAKIFARSGYFSSKVSDVAREAGVADGTVYLYFKSKEDLLTSIFSTAMDQFIHRARIELAQLHDPREQLRHFAHLHFQCLEQDRDMAIVFQIELRQSTKFMEQFSTNQLVEYFQIIRDIIESGQQSGLFRKQLSAKLVSKVLFGALDEMATNWVVSHNNHPLTTMVDPVLDIFFNGVSTHHAID